MNQLLLHKEKCKNQNLASPNILIVDCRFKYEYEGGHIKDAININCKSDLEKSFFGSKSTTESLMKQKTIIIFHCEFS